MNQKYFTKLFLRQMGETRFLPAFVEKHAKVWWKNKRSKDRGGLRLTDEGLEILRQINIELYKIPFPANFKITTQVLIQLDQFIDCPYHLNEKHIIVTSEKKAVELTLFSGDVKLYGNAKASSDLRANGENEDI